MIQITEISNRLINNITSPFKRNLYESIHWNDRLIELRGARGVGKTTLMLQKAKELQTKGKEKVLYFSSDTPYFFKNSLFDTAETFSKYGGEFLFIDEVHKYPPKYKNLDWSLEIKNIYDALPQLNIVYSGSSVLQLFKGQGDLSRRKSAYVFNGLSFREYLILNNIYHHQSYTLVQLLTNHQQIATEIISEIKVLPHFNEYLKTGYYPFYIENPDKYYDKLNEIISVVLEIDIPAVSDINFDAAYKMKKLLASISSTVPFTPNLANLSKELHITDNRTVLKYINLLEKAEMITTLSTDGIGNTVLNKPDKIYLNNANMMYALEPNAVNVGTIRETFFLNQINYLHKTNYPKSGDFEVDNKYTFEVGGKNKDQKQIKDIQNSFLVIDDIETGYGNRIPLWLFGFLY